MGAHYVAVLGDQEAFIRVLRPTLKVANMMKAKRVVWIADGAKGNWLLARRMCPLVTGIGDGSPPPVREMNTVRFSAFTCVTVMVS